VAISLTRQSVVFRGRKKPDFEGVRHLLSDGNNPYQGDAEGRLISVNDGSTWSATYNAFGWRVAGSAELFCNSAAFNFKYRTAE
jgi:hypothetical protein